jgi:Secretion system C-terminal sorting domain
MGMITDSVAWNKWEVYHYMTTTVLDTIITDADYRMYACIGPYSFPAGDTLSILIAIVAGISLEDLLANAQAALDYGVYTPVENTNIAELNFSLYQNFPNPFNPLTKINYQIPELSFVSIKVFDVLGNEITTLINEEKPTGSYEVEFKATGLPSGVYLYRLRAGKYIETKKMLLIK